MSPSSADVATWTPTDVLGNSSEFEPNCVSMSPAAIATTTGTILNLGGLGGPIRKNGPCEIEKALVDHVSGIDNDLCDAGHEDAFFVGDLGEVYRQFVRWKKHLPRVQPFYGRFFCRHVWR